MEESNKLESIQYPEIANELISMGDEDQAMRSRAIENRGVIESDEDDKLDRRNTERLKEIVSTIGWPTISKVGKQAAEDAWILVQHADHDVEFQKECLGLMKQAGKGEVELEFLAKLEDRVRVNSGELQIYGTQFQDPEKNDGEYVTQPIEDLGTVEERRKLMGLPTIAEATEEMYKKYNIEKPNE
jgi:hypothetical protein